MYVNYYDYMSESSTVFWRTVYFTFTQKYYVYRESIACKCVCTSLCT